MTALLIGCTSVPIVKSAPKGFIWGEGDALIHLASGAVFEVQYTDFVREDNRVIRYDEKARDVSVGYAYKSTFGIADIYVYPAPGQADGEILLTQYEQCKHDVFENKNVIRLLREEHLILEFDIGMLPTYIAMFLIDEGVQFDSMLILIGKGEWFVLYRISFPASTANEDILGAMTQLPWDFNYTAIR
jgi:hypothetical protein